MSKILIITADKCDDSELLYPYYRLLEEEYDVDIASFKADIVDAKYHFSVFANKSISEVSEIDYDGLLLPGGAAPEKLRQNESVLKTVRDFVSSNKPVSSICHGQQILISAKVLNGINATCYPGIRDDLINSGANYIDKQVVVDKNFVTSRRPEDLPFFMKEFINLLKKQ